MLPILEARSNDASDTNGGDSTTVGVTAVAGGMIILMAFALAAVVCYRRKRKAKATAVDTGVNNSTPHSSIADVEALGGTATCSPITGVAPLGDTTPCSPTTGVAPLDDTATCKTITGVAPLGDTTPCNPIAGVASLDDTASCSPSRAETQSSISVDTPGGKTLAQAGRSKLKGQKSRVKGRK